jgi:membrane-associated phospholipid phosphatase
VADVLEVAWRAFRASLLDLNFLYFSMGFVSVAALSLAAWVTRRAGTVAPDSRFARHVERMRAALPAIAVLSITTIAAGMQGGLEHLVQSWHNWDFTYIVYAIEGNAAEWFQDTFRSPWLDWPLVAVYTTGAFLLYYVPFFTLVVLGRARSAMRVAATIAAIWAVGIVAYFLLPVYEVWVTAGPPYHYGNVENVLFEYIPTARDSGAYMTAINNNFPSLHTAISAGIAMSLYYAREKWLARLAGVVAGGIAVATVYLGIHWFLDVFAGLLLAWGAAYGVHRRFPAEARDGERAPAPAPPAEATETS